MIDGYDGCLSCPLYAEPALQSSGPKGGILVIGESPSLTEVQRRTPFPGKHGKLLDSLFMEFCEGEFPPPIRYTNVALCHLGDKKSLTKDVLESCKHRLYREIVNSRPQKILLMGKAPCVALLGVTSLMKARGLGTWLELPEEYWGWEEHEYGPQKIYAVATYHPLSVMRNTDLFRDLADDVHKLMNHREPIEWPINHEVILDIDHLISSLDMLREASVVSCDLETTGLNAQEDTILTIGFGAVDENGEGYSIVIPTDFSLLRFFRQKGSSTKVDVRSLRIELEGMEAVIADFFYNYDGVMPFHNIKFDIQFIRVWLDDQKYRPQKPADTMLMLYCLDERGNSSEDGNRSYAVHGLKDVGRLRFDIPDYHWDWNSFYATPFSKRDWIGFFWYHAMDCAITAELYFQLLREMVTESPKLVELHDKLLVPGSLAFASVESKGALLDREYLASLEDVVASRLEGLNNILSLVSLKWVFVDDFLVDLSHELEMADEIFDRIRDKQIITLKAQGEKEEAAEEADLTEEYNDLANLLNIISHLCPEWPGLNPRSHVQIKKVYKALEFSPPSTERDAIKMEVTKPEYHPDVPLFVNSLLEYRQYNSVLRTYVRGLLERMDSSNRIHPDFRIHGTDTGRLSCRNPNFQNIPTLMGPLIKEAFIAPEGSVYVNADYGQAELRVAAWYSDDANLRKAFDEGFDIHTWVAALVFKKPMEEISSGERYAAKYVDFGVLYGRQAASLTTGFEAEMFYEQTGQRITLREANQIEQDFFDAFPKLRDFIKAQHKLVRKQQYIESPLGRRRRFPLLDTRTVRSAERRAVNTPVQGTASDFTLQAIIYLVEELPEGCFVLGAVHDSIMLEIKKDVLEEALLIVVDCMNRPLFPEFDVPMAVDVEYGPTWAEPDVKIKNATVDNLISQIP